MSYEKPFCVIGGECIGNVHTVGTIESLLKYVGVSGIYNGNKGVNEFDVRSWLSDTPAFQKEGGTEGEIGFTMNVLMVKGNYYLRWITSSSETRQMYISVNKRSIFDPLNTIVEIYDNYGWMESGGTMHIREFDLSVLDVGDIVMYQIRSSGGASLKYVYICGSPWLELKL